VPESNAILIFLLYVSSLTSPIFRSLDDLNTSFQSLKKTSDESATFVAQVRSSMAEFETERNGATDCLKSAFFSSVYLSLPSYRRGAVYLIGVEADVNNFIRRNRGAPE
jgi:hypothetical protein